VRERERERECDQGAPLGNRLESVTVVSFSSIRRMIINASHCPVR
jgi:hypothetical protein